MIQFQFCFGSWWVLHLFWEISQICNTHHNPNSDIILIFVMVRDGYCTNQKLWCIFSVCDGYYIYFKKMSQIYNTHRKSNSDTIPTKTFNPLWNQHFIELGIALVISFFSRFFCFTCVRYIFICRFNAWYVLPCAFLFSYAIANMPRKLKPSINAQQPKLGPISLENIQWTPKTRKGFGKMLTIMVAYCLSKSASKHTEDDVSNLCMMSTKP